MVAEETGRSKKAVINITLSMWDCSLCFKEVAAIFYRIGYKTLLDGRAGWREFLAPAASLYLPMRAICFRA